MITIKVRFYYHNWGPIIATVDEKGVWVVNEGGDLPDADLLELFLNAAYGPTFTESDYEPYPSFLRARAVARDLNGKIIETNLPIGDTLPQPHTITQ